MNLLRWEFWHTQSGTFKWNYPKVVEGITLRFHFSSNYYYNWRSLKYHIQHPLVVARYRPIRWIKPDKWDLGRERVV